MNSGIKIGLAPYKFINNDVDFNLSQIEKAMKRAAGKCDILLFGEAFLQGFDSLKWNFQIDKDVAIDLNSEYINILLSYNIKYKVDLGIGFLEKEDDFIYSSYMIIDEGKIKYVYRRISVGWKEVSKCDFHYKEGKESKEFTYKNNTFKIALCGDLWVFDDKFQTNGILIWPIYVNFKKEEWESEICEYAKRSNLFAGKCVMVNSIDDDSLGGAFYFENGEIVKCLPFEKEDILIVEI